MEVIWHRHILNANNSQAQALKPILFQITEKNFKELKLETTITNHVKNKKQKTILLIMLRNKNHSKF